MRIISLASFVALLPCPLFGQGYILPPVGSAPAGTVIGHVTCADTRLPARLARVSLTPVPAPRGADGHGEAGGPVDTGRGTGQTQLDGSFTFTAVPPGSYYVRVQLAGYLSSDVEFSPSDNWVHPTEEMVRRIELWLPQVTVTADGTSHVDISLQRGGTISGTVRYEDGAPLAESEVHLLRHDPNSKTNDYYEVHTAASKIDTDDQGAYRFTGLPEGEYKVYVTLQVKEPPPDPAWFQNRIVSVSDIINASSQWSGLNVYLDHDFHRTDGRSVKLAVGETSSGNDIEVRLSKLHSISGTVVDADTGSVVNSAAVKILWSGDGPNGGDAQMDWMQVGEDGSFHFGLVPEGTYKLTVTRARSVMHQVALGPPPPKAADGTIQPVQAVAPMDKTSREYSDASLPLAVGTDMAGVTVKLKARPSVMPAR